MHGLQQDANTFCTDQTGRRTPRGANHHLRRNELVHIQAMMDRDKIWGAAGLCPAIGWALTFAFALRAQPTSRKSQKPTFQGETHSLD